MLAHSPHEMHTEAFDDFDIDIELLDHNINALDVGADAKSEAWDDSQLPKEVQTALYMLKAAAVWDLVLDDSKIVKVFSHHCSLFYKIVRLFYT